MARYGMVIDLDRCTGCRGCMEACKVENNTPQANFWMYVFRFEEDEYPNTRISFLPRPCMHCDNAPCVKVCPTGARYKRDDGLVATNVDTCIGCRYCAAACPYGVNYFNDQDPKKSQYLDWSAPKAAQALDKVTGGAVPPYRNPDLDRAYGKEKRRIAGAGHPQGVMEKCTFCVPRLEKGLKPACVNVCEAFALEFGDLDDPNSAVSKRRAGQRSFRLREELGTEPRVHYIGKARAGTGARQIEEAGGR
jgi:molybdopterin-containing oxidoreductase family iron-sulfur binding subunit